MEIDIVFMFLGSVIVYFVFQRFITKKVPATNVDKEIQDILNKEEHKVKGRFE